jgi:hypothetical protein
VSELVAGLGLVGVIVWVFTLAFEDSSAPAEKQRKAEIGLAVDRAADATGEAIGTAIDGSVGCIAGTLGCLLQLLIPLFFLFVLVRLVRWMWYL